MAEIEHISTVLLRVVKEVEMAYERRQAEIRNLERREIHGSPEIQDFFDHR